MSEILRIAKLADALCEKYGCRNPFDVAEAEGVILRFCPEFQTLRGMYKVILGQRFIFLNGNMKRREARQVLAHELGHDALHREMAKDSIVQDHFLLDMTLKPEYEANLFAAQMLYGDEKVLSLLHAGKSTSECAALLGAPMPLFELKMKILEEKGLL
ncbi:MAG: ImmA/IrrE family metallo-endopeptidase [Clostridia bacterium]|nr:ImmA/IrrE family metallo-endopeptidase [Clostridia bacterium]